MIYVLRSSGFKDNDSNELETIIKIGYTGEESKKSRLNIYLTENPTIRVLYLIPDGTPRDESNLHRYFKHLRKPYGKEWFEDMPEIIEFFETHKTKDSLRELEDKKLNVSQERKSAENKRNNKDKIPLINISVRCILSGETDRTKIKDLEKYLWFHLDNFWDIIKDEFENYEKEIKEEIEKNKNVQIDDIELQEIYDNLVSEFDKDNNFERRMKLLCEIYFKYPTFYTQCNNSSLQTIIPLNYQNYINILGFEKIKALEYREKEILDYINSQNNLSKINITNLFTVGSRYSTQQIKCMLGKLYKENGITKTPKASNLKEFFELKPCKFLDRSLNKKVNGFEIVKIKE